MPFPFNCFTVADQLWFHHEMYYYTEGHLTNHNKSQNISRTLPLQLLSWPFCVSNALKTDDLRECPFPFPYSWWAGETLFRFFLERFCFRVRDGILGRRRGIILGYWAVLPLFVRLYRLTFSIWKQQSFRKLKVKFKINNYSLKINKLCMQMTIQTNNICVT